MQRDLVSLTQKHLTSRTTRGVSPRWRDRPQPGGRSTPAVRSGSAVAIARGGRTALLRFRQKASLLRVDASVAWVAAQVEAGYQVAVSCEFLGATAIPLAEALQAKGLSVARIHGFAEGAVIDLEAERIRFQTGAAQVVVFTPSASLSLHANEHLAGGAFATSASRVGLMHNVRYSGLAGRQILGRLTGTIRSARGGSPTQRARSKKRSR